MTGSENRSAEDSVAPAVTESPSKVRFDFFNILVDKKGSPDYIDLMLSVPLEDGAVAEIKTRFNSPTKSIAEDGKRDYKMDTSSNFFVTVIGKMADGPFTMQSQDGLSWEIPENYPGAGTALLIHEPTVRDFLTGRFTKGGVFVDVGANVGAYSVRAAAKGMTVYAFEPSIESVKILKRNAEVNHVSVDVQEVAIGSSEGVVKFAPNGGVSRVTPDGSVEVPIRTLDSFGLQRIDLLKVDVEGYELEVMRGAKETLARCHPTIMIEVHHWLGAEDEAQLYNILLDAGYAFEYLDRYAQGRHLVAVPKSAA